MARASKLKKEVFDPAFDDDVMHQIEQIAASPEVGQKRRLVLVICARGSDGSRALAELGNESFAHALSDVKAFEQHISDLHRIAQSAVARLEVFAPKALRARKGGKS